MCGECSEAAGRGERSGGMLKGRQVETFPCPCPSMGPTGAAERTQLTGQERGGTLHGPRPGGGRE